MHHLQFPRVRNDGGNNVRVESGVCEGGEVSTDYDAMIAKLITHRDGNYGDVRKDALDLMFQSLCEFEVGGVQTNIEFLKRVLKHEAFIKGGVTTDFIPNYKQDLFVKVDEDIDSMQNATGFAALGYLLYFNENINDKNLIGYTVNGNINGSNNGERIQLFDKNENEYNVFIKRGENDCYLMEINNEKVIGIKDVVLSEENKRLLITLNEEYIECDVSFYDNKVTIFHNGRRFDFIHSPNLHLSHSPEFVKGKGGIVIAPEPDEDSPVILHKSPMQAKVFEILVKNGDTVNKGQLMGSVESMKQLYEVWALCDGVIADIVVSKEESVDEGQILIKVERQKQLKQT